MRTSEQRWETDTVGHGIANGQWIVPSVRQLLEALEAPDWIAEDPDLHLLPHLQRACTATDSPWQLDGTAFAGGLYVVSLTWNGLDPRLSQLRADVYGLLGAIVEGTSFVRQRVGATTIDYEITTGLLEGDSPFVGHGHLVHLRVSGPVVERLIAGTHPEETPAS